MQLSLHSENIITNFGEGVYEINCTDTAPNLKGNSSFVELTVNGNFTELTDEMTDLINLVKLKIISPLNFIRFKSFLGCDKLQDVYCTGFELIYDKICYFTTLTLPNISSIYMDGEPNLHIKNLNVSNITKLNYGNFYNCKTLENLVLGSIDSIPSYAFYNCYF